MSQFRNIRYDRRSSEGKVDLYDPDDLSIVIPDVTFAELYEILGEHDKAMEWKEVTKNA